MKTATNMTAAANAKVAHDYTCGCDIPPFCTFHGNSHTPMYERDRRNARILRDADQARIAELEGALRKSANELGATRGALSEISTTTAPRGSHAEIMKRIADRALKAAK